MRTVDQIIDDAKKRYDARSKTYGMVARHDIQDFLLTLPPDMPHEMKLGELNQFLDSFPFVDAAWREKIMNDLPSYGL